MFQAKKKMMESKENKCELIDIRTGHRIEASERIRRMVEEGFLNLELTRALEKAQKSLNEALTKALGMGTMARILGLGTVILRQETNVYINNIVRLDVVLQERYPNMEERLIFANDSDELVDLACDADDPLAPRVRECLTITYSHTLVWQAA
jgi:hypothetical protein